MSFYFTKTDLLSPPSAIDTEAVLRALGATNCLSGFQQVIYMVDRIMEEPTVVSLITKRLYPETAKKFGVSDKSVERSVRTIIRHCWECGDRELWPIIACRKMDSPPSNAEFLDMLAAFIKREKRRINA